MFGAKNNGTYFAKCLVMYFEMSSNVFKPRMDLARFLKSSSAWRMELCSPGFPAWGYWIYFGGAGGGQVEGSAGWGLLVRHLNPQVKSQFCLQIWSWQLGRSSEKAVDLLWDL